eukprot:CAMPEP_0201884116 /NCGR_PEP_ID=MMETSP0902-20130614/16533_1 /ASSEMBLY_ACC=CAM_ASM_000551 /TAXON_ID=420261 /ORGANISM="Thalassiosira antarctica, Strain CCMP982" /LENGTH=123 /DNA_ID=CAMNT_0048413017 /DNA_START=217 /DNA_END=588 /DNA_ORIENTATION=-
MNLSSFILAVLVMAALVASTDADAVAARRATSAWNTPSRRRFGMTRRTMKTRSNPSFIVEQETTAAGEMHAIVQDESSSLAESLPLPRNPPRVLPSSARAAAVACVSAAAIGGARHVIELIGA